MVTKSEIRTFCATLFAIIHTFLFVLFHLILHNLVCLGLLPWIKLIDNFDAEYEYVTNEGTLFTFKTNLDAPRYRLINIDFASSDQENWKELIPQHDKDVIGELLENFHLSHHNHIFNTLYFIGVCVTDQHNPKVDGSR